MNFYRRIQDHTILQKKQFNISLLQVHRKVATNFTHSFRSPKKAPIEKLIIRKIRHLNKCTADIKILQRSLKS